MGYYIDLSTVCIDSYKAKLKASDMIPSRAILKERLDERFDYFKSMGIKTVQDLHQTLKKKDKYADLAKADCLKGDYLTILLRELDSIHPKPNKIKEFMGISADTASSLEKMGIKDTLGLFDHVKNPDSRKKLSGKTGISDTEMLELTKLADLSRIKWVGTMFARILYESGYDTVEKVSNANYEELFNTITRINKERNLYKGQIGKHDMQLCVNAAKEVPLEIEY